mmetsp:Transcript_26393/g.102877  ORF Transcript_26393/g.102877 Transcript_26393/m.102877 type:complete len:436 (-) Transcript_26393:1493-2800(-)|eukprot:CAMPEP_0113956940 /NCGR_PEP_ID=MMETSP0011_2-20120614/2398_1 /TAXON_ID=101924 /ORGANISM="Rhodosorus marinus" /LENGTH=435 /DNA_ID=CAMNT_0000967257 /DNA_START=55 /DNA_END=1362 /DNA_ORIENTATION=+ /assembly_acc=CAM_ASM_000156
MEDRRETVVERIKLFSGELARESNRRLEAGKEDVVVPRGDAEVLESQETLREGTVRYGEGLKIVAEGHSNVEQEVPEFEDVKARLDSDSLGLENENPTEKIPIIARPNGVQDSTKLFEGALEEEEIVPRAVRIEFENTTENTSLDSAENQEDDAKDTEPVEGDQEDDSKDVELLEEDEQHDDKTPEAELIAEEAIGNTSLDSTENQDDDSKDAEPVEEDERHDGKTLEPELIAEEAEVASSTEDEQTEEVETDVSEVEDETEGEEEEDETEESEDEEYEADEDEAEEVHDIEEQEPAESAETKEVSAANLTEDASLEVADNKENQPVQPKKKKRVVPEPVPKELFLEEDGRVGFKWRHGARSRVELIASFSGWERSFKMERQGSHWHLRIKLEPGKYQYKYLVDGEWMYDILEPNGDDGDGNFNNFIIVKPRKYV